MEFDSLIEQIENTVNKNQKSKRRQTRRQLERQLISRSKRSIRPKCSKSLQKPAEPRPQNLPLWAPAGVDLTVVPPEVQQACAELIQPIYEQFVVKAADGMEKSIGITVSHLLWLEILDQFDIKREYTQIEAVLNISHSRPEMIDRHLKLIDAKLRIGYFLLRIKELRQRLENQPQPPLLPGIPAAAPIDILPNQLPNSQNQPVQP